jgi:UPF0042 nucleotide-binding protein
MAEESADRDSDEERGGAGREPDELRGEIELVVITGMSGAGRSEAIHTFEDLGYFCIDNLPPSFLRQVVDLASLPGSRIRRVAVVSDVRAMEFFDELVGELEDLEDDGVPFQLVFLETDTDRLIRRFKETRRRHPMAVEGESLVQSINAERKALAVIRARADVIIDTSRLKPADLKRVLRERYAESLSSTLTISVISFGFKHSMPSDADIVMDVRFLPNPYYVLRLRDRTGLERAVRDYVLEREETQEFLSRWFDLLDQIVPGYIEEGKQHLTIAMGCTGGMHRSVVLAEVTADHLRRGGWHVTVGHRDMGRDLESH